MLISISQMITLEQKILKQNEQEQEEIDKQIEEEQPKEEPENTISPNEKEMINEEEKPTLVINNE